MIQIGDIILSSEILTTKFACDYEKCKGCCCIIGDSGAPLEESEAEILESEFPRYKKFMEKDAIKAVNMKGFYEIDSDGDIVTPLMTGKEECVYSCFDEDYNCFCAVEKSWLAGESNFRKPISCWLYPIRVSKLSNGLTALNLHRWTICGEGYIKGDREDIPLYIFLKDPIISCFGEDFYHGLKEAAKMLIARS